jgi:tetratricopeptide (TPR) repeat protein
MKCEDLFERLSLKFVRELGEDLDFRAHLSTCESCARRAELSERIWELAGLAPLEPVPAATLREVSLKIHRLRRRPRGLFVSLLPWGAAAAAAILLWAGLRSRDLRPAPEPSPPLCADDRAGYVEPAFGTLVVQDERERGPLGLRSHSVAVEISDWVMRTEIEEVFVNSSDRRLEGTFHFPLPADASLSRFAMEVNGALVEGELVERVRAREVYEGIVRKMQDPALLEWMPGNVFKARIFPIEPYSQKRVILAYTQAPRMWNGALSYVYPLVSEKTTTHPPEELSVRTRVRLEAPIARLECPTHRADVARPDPWTADVRVVYRNARPTEDFQLRVEVEPEELRAASHKPMGEDGYLGLAFSPRAPSEALVAGTYVFVIDRSARMSEPELKITRRLVDRLIDRLEKTDRVGFVAHHIDVLKRDPEYVTPERRGAWRDFLMGLRGEGASDVLEALKSAAVLAPAGATVVYVGKGVPTWGETDGGKVAAEGASALRGRSFRAILVGSGANEEGLALLAGLREGGIQRIIPGGDTAAEIAAIARTIAFRPIQELEVSAEGVKLYHILPAKVPAVYPGERVNLFARYVSDAAGRPAAVIVRGWAGGSRFEKRLELTLAQGPTEYGAFTRLWAQRWLAQRTADCQRQGDPREEVEGIVAVSRKYQVMTPYTSFLVLESEEAYKQFQIERAKRLEEQARAPNPKREAKEELEELGSRLARRLAGAEKLLHERSFSAAEQELESMDRDLAAVPGAREKLGDLATRITDSRATAKIARLAGGRRSEWDDLIKELRRSYEVSEAGKDSQADEHYRLAERYYQAGDYEKTTQECQKALSLRPNHAPSKALFMEVQFILGQGKVTPESDQYDKYMKEALLRHSQTLLEIDSALKKGQDEYNRGEFDQAGREFRRILEFAKWMPTGIELESRRKTALEMLDRTREVHRKKSLDEETPRPKMIQESEPRASRPKANPAADFRTRVEQSQIEIAQHVRNGERFYAARMYPEALHELESAQFKISAIPYPVESMKELLPAVTARVQQVQNARTLEELRAKEEKRSHSLAEHAAHDTSVKREVTRKIAQLLERSYMAFDQRNFDRCIELCDEVLAIDRHYPVAKELKEDSEKARHKEEYYAVLARKVEAWKAQTDDDEQVEVPWAQTLSFPSREEWAEISKRLGESVVRSGTTGGVDENPDLQAIRRKLDTLKMDLNFDNAKVEDILAYIRDYSGLNIVLDAAVQSRVDPEKTLTFKSKDLALKDNLKLLLSQVGLEYRVTDERVVLLTDPKKARAGLASASRGGGPALTGATFPLESDGAGFSSMEVDRAGDDRVRGTRKVDQVRVLEILFGQAQVYFERGEYAKSAQVAERMLSLHPQLAGIPELSQAAQRLGHAKEGLEARPDQFGEWRQKFERSLRDSVGPDWVDSPAWKEMLLRRKSKGISSLEEELMPEDQSVLDKLNSIRITLDMQNAPLTSIVDTLREVTGLNIRIIGVDSPDREMITFKVNDFVLEGALKLLLGPRQKAYLIKDGGVLITTAETAQKVVKLELYDVRDLTYQMKDFPGVDLSLVNRGTPRQEEPKPQSPEPLPKSLPAEGRRDAAPRPPESETRRILEAMKLEIDLAESSAAVVLAFFRNYTELVFVVEEEAKARLEGTRASGFKVKGLSLKEALGRFLEPRGLEFQVDERGSVVVSLRLFTGEDLALRVREAIGADRWSESEGKSIQFQNGLLIVRNSEEDQEKVKKLLRELRGQGDDR